MNQYYFLFALAFIWTLVATIQDIKKREVANWLNFSLIAFALAYRAFYALHSSLNFFLYGLIGFVLFFVISYALYYARAFAGGDAKLLMGFGIILPYEKITDFFFLPLIFLFALFFIGAIYSLLYSISIVIKNEKQFKKEFSSKFKKNKIVNTMALIIFTILIIAGFRNQLAFFFSIFFLIPIIITYTKSLDKCMIKLYHPEKLTEGDWLEKEVRVGGKTIKKSVHGLSLDDIELLKRHNRSVLIKEGIPFVPAFLITLIVMGYVLLVLHWSPTILL